MTVRLVRIAILLPIVCLAQQSGYQVSVGRLAVNAKSDQDIFSGIDFQVRIRREDPVVQARLDGINAQIGDLDREADSLLRRMNPLQHKESQSEIEPGPPLSDSERKQQERLFAMPSSKMSLSQKRKLRRLNRKEEMSKVQPGPPLTAEEISELQAIRDRLGTVRYSLRTLRGDRSEAQAMIYGSTGTIETRKTTVYFNSGPILKVYEGDFLQVTAVDDDLFRDDVFGVHRFAVTGQMLRNGGVDLGSVHLIRSLELNFSPSFR